MTDAPTEIWAAPSAVYSGYAEWDEGDWTASLSTWTSSAGAKSYTLTSFHEGKINLRDQEIERLSTENARLRNGAGRFRTAIRVNCLRNGGTHEDADKVIAACEKGQPHD